MPIHKAVGQTPLEAIEQLRIQTPELYQVKLSYAGRLDPLAEGVLLVLVGEANKERDAYLGLDKVYEFEMVLGVRTDSYDLLGLVEKVNTNIGNYNIEKDQIIFFDKISWILAIF